MNNTMQMPEPSPAITAAVDKFFEKAASDSLLKLYFADVDLARHRKHFASYVAHLVAGKESAYPGRDLLAAHVGRGIMDEAADRFVEEFVQSLRDCGVPPAQVDALDRMLSGKKDLVGDSFVSPDTYVYKPQRMG